MGKMIFCTGENCPILNLCARFTRTPKDISKPYDVFKMAPYAGPDAENSQGCQYYWPEAYPGQTEKPINDDHVLHMGGKEKDHIGNQRVNFSPEQPPENEPDEPIHPDFIKAVSELEPGLPDAPGITDYNPDPKPTIHMPSVHVDEQKRFDTDIPEGVPAHKPAILWPTAEEQKDVFDMLCRTESDIIELDTVSRENRSSNPREVWLVLDGIRARMRKLIYGFND